MNDRLIASIASVFVLLSSTNPARASAPAPHACGGEHATPTSTMEAVFARLAHQSLTARFCQSYNDVVTGPRPEECGKVWAAADGKLRFAYDGKEGKLFVFDGRTAYFLEPEAAQLTLMENFAHTPLAQSLAVLWGHGAWRGVFAFRPSPVKAEAPFERAVRLTPLQAREQVAAIDVIVDTRVCEVVRSKVSDPLGNVTSYTLSDRQRGQPLESGLFKVTAPKGFSVLRAPSGSGSERQSHRTTPTKRAADVDKHHGIQLIDQTGEH